MTKSLPEGVAPTSHLMCEKLAYNLLTPAKVVVFDEEFLTEKGCQISEQIKNCLWLC